MNDQRKCPHDFPEGCALQHPCRRGCGVMYGQSEAYDRIQRATQANPIRATVGRIVHYTTGEPEGNGLRRRPLAAIVIRADTSLVLRVMADDEPDRDVLNPPYSVQPEIGHWSWPPRI